MAVGAEANAHGTDFPVVHMSEEHAGEKEMRYLVVCNLFLNLSKVIKPTTISWITSAQPLINRNKNKINHFVNQIVDPDTTESDGLPQQ